MENISADNFCIKNLLVAFFVHMFVLAMRRDGKFVYLKHFG